MLLVNVLDDAVVESLTTAKEDSNLLDLGQDKTNLHCNFILHNQWPIFELKRLLQQCRDGCMLCLCHQHKAKIVLQYLPRWSLNLKYVAGVNEIL